MKKLGSLLCIFTLLCSIVAIPAKADEYDEENAPSTTTVITDREEISSLAEELELNENPDDIVQIIISDNEFPFNEDKMVPTPADDFFSKEEIVFQITYHNPNKRGNLLRSSDYVYPGGTMTISESVAISYNTTIGLSAEIISSEIGFDVSGSVSVSDSQNIDVPYGKTYTCNAYVKLDHYEFTAQ